ncbi:hypothetical protein pf16_115 [Pseudomonas phage pf16]|uniref:Terminase small subunit n=1 Tax=Pseudomonas phage pf16 TaxID=1815630 RepID=A0A1S5R3Q5_9CAUD|nr:terminase small subunit [Pseudomonas phage pf16]AND75038.1 hypothetical protein pf16_115 [Pseudomonas phage pf16]
MNDRQQTRFEERLNQIIGAEDDVSKALDALDGETAKSTLPTVVEYDKVPSKIEESAVTLPADMVDDYKFSRDILRGLIARGIVALEGATIVARESEHPKAFEVAATLMKGIADVTKDLMALQKTVSGGAGAAGKQTIKQQINVQQNFNGSPGDPKSIAALLDGLEDAVPGEVTDE